MGVFAGVSGVGGVPVVGGWLVLLPQGDLHHRLSLHAPSRRPQETLQEGSLRCQVPLAFQVCMLVWVLVFVLTWVLTWVLVCTVCLCLFFF